MNKFIFSFLLLVITRTIGFSQSVGIGTSAPDASAVLELKGTTKGFLPPRMLASEKILIPSPKEGLIIYQTDGTKGLYIYNGNTWEALAGTSSGFSWALNGNSGTNSSSFVGTKDNQPLKFRVNNISAGIINALDENVGLGVNTLTANNGGGMNNAFGSQALAGNTTGYNNNALGRRALFSNIDGSGNVAMGTSALVANVSGNGNTAIGFNASYDNITGFSNIAIGTHSSYKNQAGYRTIAVGDSALFNSMAIENVAIGSKAMYNNDDGILNTAVGNQALFKNTSGSQNTALGWHSLFNNISGVQNTALGFQSAFSNSVANRNTGIGYNSLFYNVIGSDNTALGYNSLANNTAKNNTAVGSEALSGNSSGDRGTAVGLSSLRNNTTGSSNTAVGSLSLTANKDGSVNTAVGDFSLADNVNGNFNSAIGAGAMSKNISGGYNVAIGNNALNNNSSGFYNTAIGADADIFGTDYNNATAIGAKAQVACSNCIVLGSTTGYNGATANVKVGIGSTNPQKTLHVNPNGAGGILIGNDMTTGGYTGMNLGISQASGGYSFIQSVKAAWPSSTYGDLVFNLSGGNVGVRKAAPLTPLHIKQSTDLDGTGGLRLERNENGNYWDISNTYADVLIFSYKSVDKVRFSNIDGDIYTASDLRLKKDIQNFEAALPRLMKLEAKSYHYKDNEKSAPLSYGFIAQEVENIFPGAVSSNGINGMKSIAYQKLNIMAIKAIQEQQGIIEKLKQQVLDNAAENKMQLAKQQYEMEGLKAQVKTILEAFEKSKK